MNIFEVGDKVLEAQRKYKLSIQDIDDMIYYFLQDHYKTKPPTFKEFLTNPMYLPGVGDTIYPVWWEIFDKIYPSIFMNPYYLILLYASTSSGKSTVLTIIAAYELCKVLCLKNPMKTYNLGLNDIMYFDFHMPTKTMGEQTNWAKFINLLNLSPFFLQEINIPSPSSNFGLLTQNIATEIITCKEDTVSKAVFFVGMDEYNEKKNSTIQNDNIYKCLDRRMEGRFLDTSGFVPYKFVVASSPKDTSDNLSKLTDELDKLTQVGNKKAFKTGIIPQWKTRGSNLIYCGEEFGIYLGDEYNEPSIIKNLEDIPSEYDIENIKRVPIEYLRSFEQDLYGSIQDILGIGTHGTGKFYKNRTYLESAFCRKNLFAKDTLIIPFNIGLEDGVKLLKSYFDYSKITYPEIPRCIHVDVALNGDRLGLSSCFTIPANHIKGGGKGIFKDLMYINDFSIGIECANEEDIPLDVVAEFIKDLDKIGYPVGLVTHDGYQSASISQPLDRAKISNKLVSLDRSKEPYTLHKRAVVQGRYIGVNNTILIDEFTNLLNLPLKIDHDSEHSKDISDSIAGSFFGCFMYDDIISKNTRIIKSLQRKSASDTLLAKLAKSGFGTMKR